jgi:hypothetical protein
MYRLVLAGYLLAASANLQAAEPSDGQPQFSEDMIKAIDVPDLNFSPKPEDVKAFGKYYYFQRNDTTFNQALADINECDALASGISYFRGSNEPYAGYYVTQYGIGGGIGGVVGGALADAIFGSATRRAVRRINMRNCMGFKGYQRFGVSKSIWIQFNFEEGGGREDEDTRRTALLKQARIASGPKPKQEPLEQ